MPVSAPALIRDATDSNAPELSSGATGSFGVFGGSVDPSVADDDPMNKEKPH